METRAIGSRGSYDFDSEAISEGASPEQVIAMATMALDEQDRARRTARRACVEAERQAQGQRIGEMREAADDRFAAAMVEGVASLASTGIEMADTVQSSSALEAQREADAFTAEAGRVQAEATRTEDAIVRSGLQQSATELNAGAARMNAEVADSRVASRWAQSGRQGLQAGAGMVRATLERSASESDIRAEELSQTAAAHRLEGDEMADDAARARALQDKALGHLDRIADARMQAILAASRG